MFSYHYGVSGERLRMRFNEVAAPQPKKRKITWMIFFIKNRNKMEDMRRDIGNVNVNISENQT